jgi:hypothetical protein
MEDQMVEDIPRCEDGSICGQEFAPTKAGNVCIRCGHADPCHRHFDFGRDRTDPLSRVCFWKRDDKTIHTCSRDYDNSVNWGFGNAPSPGLNE